jgi:O-antigen/teichoic acid export membrane protein
VQINNGEPRPLRRIVINTAASYSRSILSAALALLGTRWVLLALGQTDFGLYSVIGSVIIFITFLNNVMAGSVSRFFAFSIGRGVSSEVKVWFNVALRIHVIFALSLTSVGWWIGEYAIRNILTIPTDRIDICVSMFHISLVSAFFSMVSIPYVAMTNAQQRIAELAGWGLLQSFLTFMLAWSLRYSRHELLLVYTAGVCCIIVFIQIAQIFRARNAFPECRLMPRLRPEIIKMKEMFNFAFLTLFGNLGAVGRDQGSALLINKFFGPNINAAYGLASQVCSLANQLSVAMINAISPEITSSEGRGDRERMLGLSLKANQLSSTLISLFAIPLIFEIDYLLKAWLTEPPSMTVPFVQTLMITFIIDRLGTGYILAFSARGTIVALQTFSGMILLSALPVSFLLFRNSFPPTIISAVFLVSITILLCTRVALGKFKLGIPVGEWVRVVLLPSLATIASSGLVVFLTTRLLPQSLLRFLLSFSLGGMVNLTVTYLVILTKNQRVHIRRKLHLRR